jgi:hypothetical protein
MTESGRTPDPPLELVNVVPTPLTGCSTQDGGPTAIALTFVL